MKPMNLSSPHLIIMVGIPGSGKSFFAEHFSATFNAPYISFEKISKELDNVQSTDSEQQSAVIRFSNYMLEQLLKTGQTIIYEGIVDSRTTRQALAKIAKSKGYEPLLVWVQTESLASRIRATKPQKDKPYLSSDEFDAVLRRFTPPNASENPVVISGKHTYASQLKIVLKRLTSTRAESAQAAGKVEGRHIPIR